MSIASLTFRTWLRYVVPLGLLAVVALVAVTWFGITVRSPTDALSAHGELQLGWGLAAGAWVFQLWLVAGVAPSVRGVARGEPLTQMQALTHGALSLARAAVPCGIAAIAIVIGFTALVVPGLALLVLLAATGASDELGKSLPSPLVDSVAAARGQLRSMAIVIAIVVGVDLAIALVAHLVVLPALPKKPSLALLLPSRTFVRIVAAGLVATAPLLATAIAAVYAHPGARPKRAAG